MQGRSFGRKYGNRILEKDRLIIKEQLKHLSSDSQVKKPKLEKDENEEVKSETSGSNQDSQIKPTWIKVDQKCSKCGQKVSDGRRKSL